jgi:hypothetical protein
MNFRTALLSAGILALPHPTHAQQSAVVVGVVVDSLHGGGLRGAEITLSGRSSVAVTDSLGRFRFDTVPPGMWQVGAFHPLLDSLGISIGSKPFLIGGDSAGVILLAVPSAHSLVRELCALRPTDKLSGMLMGRITDPESGFPVAQARVAAQWSSYVMKGKKKVEEIPHAVVSESDNTGLFRLCGIPFESAVRMHVERDGIPSPDLQVVLGRVPIGMVDFSIRSRESRAVGRVVGRLVDPSGKAVDEAYVQAEGTGISTMTNWNGEFFFDGMPIGTQVLAFKKLGFTPIAVPTFVSLQPPEMVTYEMTKAVPILETISVVEKANWGLTRVGFTARRKTAIGSFMTAEDIQKQKSTRLSEVLRRLPGLALDEPKGPGYVKATRETKSSAESGCIRMIIDGTEWMMPSEGYVDGAIPLSRVGAIELYHPLDVPPEYSVTTNCTTILVWSKNKLRAKY